MTLPGLYARGATELADLAERLDGDSLEAACQTIAKARRIVVYGCGREGLMLRGFAMRLYHLGRDVVMQGDMTTPPLGPGDLFLTSAGPGALSTVTALCRTARTAGAEVLYLTAEPGAVPSGLADQLLVIPAQTMARDQGPDVQSTLPMGSLFEGAMFLVFEAMVLRLMDMLGETPDSMRSRHTNIE